MTNGIFCCVIIYVNLLQLCIAIAVTSTVYPHMCLSLQFALNIAVDSLALSGHLSVWLYCFSSVFLSFYIPHYTILLHSTDDYVDLKMAMVTMIVEHDLVNLYTFEVFFFTRNQMLDYFLIKIVGQNHLPVNATSNCLWSLLQFAVQMSHLKPSVSLVCILAFTLN